MTGRPLLMSRGRSPAAKTDAANTTSRYEIAARD
jgi:hypothetical protein